MIVARLDRMLYRNATDNWNDQLFREQITERLEEGSVMLDLGAGSGIVSQMNFKGIVVKVCGVDPDPRVMSNPYLDEARIGCGEAIPYPDITFDVVIACNVLEHLQNPEKVFTEIYRVLKPGWIFLIETPNKYHYMPLIARMTSHQFHEWYNSMRGRVVEDTYYT